MYLYGRTVKGRAGAHATEEAMLQQQEETLIKVEGRSLFRGVIRLGWVGGMVVCNLNILMALQRHFNKG